MSFADEMPPGKKTPGTLRRAATQVLQWLRLIDEEDGLLSLTNLAVWVALGKLVFVAAATVLDLGTFAGAMLAYGYKAHRRSRAAGEREDREAAVAVASGTPDLAPTVAKVAELASKVTEWEGRLETLGSTVAMAMRGKR